MTASYAQLSPSRLAYRDAAALTNKTNAEATGVPLHANGHQAPTPEATKLILDASKVQEGDFNPVVFLTHAGSLNAAAKQAITARKDNNAFALIVVRPNQRHETFFVPRRTADV